MDYNRGSTQEKVWNIVTIGDGMVGKTSLLHRYVDEKFNIDYIPTIFDKKEFSINVNGEQHLVKLYDTAGQEEYDQLRKAAYKFGDCFLICYSVDNRTSYNNIIPFWMKELPSSLKHVPIVLCATQIDKRRTNPNCITEQQGLQLKEKIRASTYVECSAKTNAGVVNAINSAVEIAILATQQPIQMEPKVKQHSVNQNQRNQGAVVENVGEKIRCKTCCTIM